MSSVASRSAEERERTCPSGRCRPGSTLLGIRGPDGTLLYTPRLPPLDEELAERFTSGGGTSAYRFAETCVTDRCLHWNGSACVLAAALVQPDAVPADAPVQPDPSVGLPRCAIRATCRWFFQEGRNACAVCPLVLRDEPMIAETVPA